MPNIDFKIKDKPYLSYLMISFEVPLTKYKRVVVKDSTIMLCCKINGFSSSKK